MSGDKCLKIQRGVKGLATNVWKFKWAWNVWKFKCLATNVWRQMSETPKRTSNVLVSDVTAVKCLGVKCLWHQKSWSQTSGLKCLGDKGPWRQTAWIPRKPIFFNVNSRLVGQKFLIIPEFFLFTSPSCPCWQPAKYSKKWINSIIEKHITKNRKLDFLKLRIYK